MIAETRTLHVRCDALEGDPDKSYSTYRNGRKWADLQPGDIIQLCCCGPANNNHRIVGEGKVDEILFLPFHELRFHPELVETCHNPENRTYEALARAMARAYGDAWTCENGTAVLVYHRLPAVPPVSLERVSADPDSTVRERMSISANEVGTLDPAMLFQEAPVDKLEPILSDLPLIPVPTVQDLP